jgi:hypothetical protein
MRARIARVLLSLSSITLLFGGLMHALAFVRKAAPALNASHLPAFFVAELKSLWLADSTTLIAVGVIYAVAAIVPRAIPGLVLLLVSAVPAGTTLLIYGFLGGFYAAHLLAASTLMASGAGLLRMFDAPRAMDSGIPVRAGQASGGSI